MQVKAGLKEAWQSASGGSALCTGFELCKDRLSTLQAEATSTHNPLYSTANPSCLYTSTMSAPKSALKLSPKVAVSQTDRYPKT